MREIIRSAAGVSGYDATKAMCYAFYNYATINPDVFNIMLWYNKFRADESTQATVGLIQIIFKIEPSPDLSEENCFHLIRTFRGFLESFFLLVNKRSFGHSLSEYYKHGRSIGELCLEGDGDLKSCDTEYGRIGPFICSDLVFSSRVRQAGKSGVDILIVPASDWKEITRIALKTGAAFIC